jgi:mono/diheme cytochrome c family protein
MRCLSALFAAAVLIGLGDGHAWPASLAAAGSAGGLQRQSKPVPSSPASIKEGMKSFAARCRPCHGLRGRGDGTAVPPGAKPANLVDAEWKHGSTDALIFKNIKEGIAPFEFMKPQAGLMTDTEIWNVVNYLRSLAPEAKK